MSRPTRRDPLKVMLVWIIVLALLVGATWLVGTTLTGYRRARLAAMVTQAQEANTQKEQEYALALAEFQREQASSDNATQQWPTQNPEGWDVVDLTGYPLESPGTVTVSRAEAMHGGLLLVNEWHSRPQDFDESVMLSMVTYAGDRRNFGVQNGEQKLHPLAIEALISALADAKAVGLEHYVVNYAYRSYADQETLFNNQMQKIVDDYGDRYTGDALIARAKRDVNYPGTSEFNTGMSVTLYLYEKGNSELNKQKFSTSQQGLWMYENSWKYGLIFRFPGENFPVEGVMDKSYKTGVSVQLNCYRYVGKAHAAVMHQLDLCLEEYIEYLQEHPHIAVFEDGVLKYEIVRQYVGDEADTFSVDITQRANGYTMSLDNMGGVITAFSY